MATEPTSYRIAHISDLHLGQMPNHLGILDDGSLRERLALGIDLFRKRDLNQLMGTYSPRYLRPLVRALSARGRYVTEPYDAIVVTGDIAATGLIRDLTSAATFLSGGDIPGSRDLGRPGLRHPVDSFVLLPGNHDRYAERTCAPVSCEFESGQHFGPDWTCAPQQHASERSLVNSSLLPMKNGARLAFVTMDFSYRAHDYPSVIRYLGRGRAAKDTLELACAETNKYADQKIPVVWAMHFPPTSEGMKLKLEQREEVIKAARQSKVEVIFAGHKHEADSNLQVSASGGFTGIRVIRAGTPCAAGRGSRSYFEVDLKVLGDRVSVSKVRTMAYTPMRPTKDEEAPLYEAEFCPVPERVKPKPLNVR